MSKAWTETTRFQECDFCKEKIKLEDWFENLETVNIPCLIARGDDILGRSVQEFSLCRSCLKELHKAISRRLGITVNLMNGEVSVVEKPEVQNDEQI